jgi:hypothetical protein
MRAAFLMLNQKRKGNFGGTEPMQIVDKTEIDVNRNKL